MEKLPEVVKTIAEATVNFLWAPNKSTTFQGQTYISFSSLQSALLAWASTMVNAHVTLQKPISAAPKPSESPSPTAETSGKPDVIGLQKYVAENTQHGQVQFQPAFRRFRDAVMDELAARAGLGGWVPLEETVELVIKKINTTILQDWVNLSSQIPDAGNLSGENSEEVSMCFYHVFNCDQEKVSSFLQMRAKYIMTLLAEVTAGVWSSVWPECE